MAADTRRALEGSHESHHCPSRCTPGIREHRRGPAVPGQLGVARRPPDAGVVSGREVRHLHPLGRLLGAVLRAGAPGQARLRRVVLERADRTARAPKPSPIQAGTWEYHRQQYGADFDYQDFAPQFRAELFDPDHWADVFARSGAKYVVPTSKHHEGFALWPSREASATWGRPWNAVEIGPKRDLLGDLTKAVRAQGPEDGLLLLALRVVQPALAHRQAALRRGAHVPAVQGRRHALQAVDHLLRRRVGPALGRLAAAPSCWPGCSTSRR